MNVVGVHMSRDASQVWAERAAATAALTTALSGLDYPTTKADAIRDVGAFELDDGVPLGLILQGVREDAFRDYSTAAKATDKHWERIARTLAQIDAAEAASRRR